MEKVSLEEVDIVVNPLEVHSVRKPLSDALGTDEFAVNYFELEPGESFSGGMHRHHDQEELFYVLEGTATFETPGETVDVDAGGCIRFAPGEYQQGSNETDDSVRAFAFGAPGARHDWDELDALVHCRNCEEETDHSMALTEDGQFSFTCQSCGNSF